MAIVVVAFMVFFPFLVFCFVVFVVFFVVFPRMFVVTRVLDNKSKID